MQNQQTALVRLVDITKYFGGVRALHSVSLELYAGEITCLVGDNGAGKTTLVKILNGLHQPDLGEVWLGNTLVRHNSPQKSRQLGVETVHQHLSLCDNLGAAANVTLGQEPTRFRLGPLGFIGFRQSQSIARQRINDVGIELSDLDVPVRTLSGGQRQAIAIARATVHGHRLIMFDEPTAALGIAQTRATLELVRRVADQGMAVILISHNLDDIFAVADRIVALRLGEVSLDETLGSTNREKVVACMSGLSFTKEANSD